MQSFGSYGTRGHTYRGKKEENKEQNSNQSINQRSRTKSSSSNLDDKKAPGNERTNLSLATTLLSIENRAARCSSHKPLP